MTTIDKDLIIKTAKRHALKRLKEANKEGGDYWNSITLYGVDYDYNLYDYETDGKVWGLAVYPLERQDETDNLYINTDEPIVEGLPVYPKSLESFDCTCCGEKLIKEELVNAETLAGGHCFHCQKGNCEICGSGEDDND